MTVGAAAVSAITVTELTNSEVESGQSASHTLSFDADAVSADGSTDVIYVEFSDEYAGNLSFSTASFTNRSTGATVPISSSTNIVDGPDGDGVRETLRTGVSKDADYATDEITGTYEFGLSHPSVMETTSYDLEIRIVDSQTGNASTTATDAITVLAGETQPTTTDSEQTTEDSTTDQQTTERSMTDQQTTERSMTDAQTSEQETDGMETARSTTETETGTGPGFGTVGAVLGLLAGLILLGRRY